MKEISKKTIERYNNRFFKLGNDIKTLGWDTKENQELRFNQTLLNGIDFSNKSILDIGCGFGDYAAFLHKRIPQMNGQILKNYVGIDLNSNLVGQAIKNNLDSQNVKFETFDIVKGPYKNTEADIGIMLGLLNFRLQESNLEYSKKIIKNAFMSVKEALIVDFLSTKTTNTYPKEDFVYYHEPSDVLKFALEITNNLKLLHDYAPIPQKEFMIIMRK